MRILQARLSLAEAAALIGLLFGLATVPLIVTGFLDCNRAVAPGPHGTDGPVSLPVYDDGVGSPDASWS